jgi:hypothetical protein
VPVSGVAVECEDLLVAAAVGAAGGGDVRVALFLAVVFDALRRIASKIIG